MIPIERLHYKIDQQLNKQASNAHQWIAPAPKDLAINEAQIKLVKRKLDVNNSYGVGMDGFRKRYQDLEFLVVPHEEVAATKLKSPISTYSLTLSSLNKKFFVPVDIYTSASRNSCTGRIVWIENIAKHSDVPTYLGSTHLQPSFAYQVTFGVISSGKFLIYTEDKDGDFAIDKVYLSYLRYPTPVSSGAYQDFSGATTIKTDCEFPEHLEDELIALVVQELALSTENQMAATASQLRIKENE